MELAPETAISLANAVSMHFTGRYPADNHLPVTQNGKSIILHEGQRGTYLYQTLEHSVLVAALNELKVMDHVLYTYLEEGVTWRLKKYYAPRFYTALAELWHIIERRNNVTQRNKSRG